MSDKTISQLPDGGSIQAADKFLISRNGYNYSVTGSGITTALSGVAGLIANSAAQESEISALQGTVATVIANAVAQESEIGVIQTATTNLWANAATQQAVIGGLATTITGIQTSLTASNGAVTALQTNVAAVQSSVSGLQANAVAQDAAINATNSNVTAVQANVASIQGAVSLLQSNAVAQESEISVLQSASTSLLTNAVAQQASISSLSGAVLGLQNNATTATTSVSALQATVANTATAASVTAVQANVTSLQSTVSGLLSNAAAQESEISTLQGTVSNLQANAVSQESEISALQATTNTLISNAGAQQSVLSALLSNAAAQESEISVLQASNTAVNSALSTHVTNLANPHGVTAAQVGLGNVNNTSDANKPISTATQSAINAANSAASSALTAHTNNVSNPHGVTAAQVGLGNVNNTSDANKPISTATQNALNLLAPLSNPTFSGTVTLPAIQMGSVLINNATAYSVALGSNSNQSIGIELGSTNTATTPYVDFHSSGTNSDYDSRIIAVGNAAAGTNTLNFTTSAANFSGNIRANGQSVLGDITAAFPSSGVAIPESAHSSGSKRAAISIGNNWVLLQDANGTGYRDFGLFNSSKGSFPLYVTPDNNVSFSNSITITGSVTSSESGIFNNLTATNGSGTGDIRILPGFASVTGYAAFHAASGARQGYIGFGTTNGTLNIVSEAGRWDFNGSAQPTIYGQTIWSQNNLQFVSLYDYGTITLGKTATAAQIAANTAALTAACNKVAQVGGTLVLPRGDIVFGRSGQYAYAALVIQNAAYNITIMGQGTNVWLTGNGLSTWCGFAAIINCQEVKFTGGIDVDFLVPPSVDGYISAVTSSYVQITLDNLPGWDVNQFAEVALKTADGNSFTAYGIDKADGTPTFTVVSGTTIQIPLTGVTYDILNTSLLKVSTLCVLKRYHHGPGLEGLVLGNNRLVTFDRDFVLRTAGAVAVYGWASPIHWNGRLEPRVKTNSPLGTRALLTSLADGIHLLGCGENTQITGDIVRPGDDCVNCRSFTMPIASVNNSTTFTTTDQAGPPTLAMVKVGQFITFIDSNRNQYGPYQVNSVTLVGTYAVQISTTSPLPTLDSTYKFINVTTARNYEVDSHRLEGPQGAGVRFSCTGLRVQGTISNTLYEGVCTFDTSVEVSATDLVSLKNLICLKTCNSIDSVRPGYAAIAIAPVKDDNVTTSSNASLSRVFMDGISIVDCNAAPLVIMGTFLASINGLHVQNVNVNTTAIRGMAGGVFAQIQNVYRVEFNDVHYVQYAKGRLPLNLNNVTEMRMKGCTGLIRPTQGISFLDADTDFPTSYLPNVTALNGGQAPGVNATTTFTIVNNMCTVFFNIAITSLGSASSSDFVSFNLPPNVTLGANQVGGGGREIQSVGTAFTVSLSGTTKVFLANYDNTATMQVNRTYVGSFSFPVAQF